MAANATPSQELPVQYKKVFDNMSSAFDNRQYDKAVRYADQILAAHPHNGETMAMKGLVLHTQDKKEEGIHLIRHGIAKNFQSSVSWHCLGLVQKADKQHGEACKAFKRSVMLDSKNLNAARDLSSSAIQIRDWAQFVEIRQMMLSNKSNIRANWVGLSCAHRMNGSTELALAIMDIMTQIMDSGASDHETSEVHLYRAELEMLLKRPSRALDILRINDVAILDEPAKILLRAHAHAALKQHDKAEKLFLDSIIAGNHEAEAIVAMARGRGIPMDDRLHLPVHHCAAATDEAVAAHCASYVALLDQVAAAAPRCDAAKRFALDVCVPAEFEGRLKAYIRPFIVKMIPSVTSILKSLYNYYPAADSRIVTIGTVLHQWEAALEKGDFEAFFASFEGTAASPSSPSSPATAADRNPALLLWIYQFLASHYLRTKQYAKAHEYADKAIDHTPTIEMLYLLKAKISSREGDLAAAAQLADTARVLDLQDKYLSAKAAKYFFRIGDVAKAEANLQLFMKESEDPSHTYLAALDAQTAWYERECGDAFMVKDDPISALQNYAMFEKHHKDNHDEMVDFHNYTFRRCTMRQWIEVQEFDYEIGRQNFFLLTCPRMVKCYMAIARDGEEAVRARHVARPAPLAYVAPAEEPVTKEDKDAEKEREAEFKQRHKQYAEHYLKDIDTTEPLLKARRYVDALLHYRPNEAETHTLAAEYFLALPVLPAPVVARSLVALKRIADPSGASFEGYTVPNADRAKAAAALPNLQKVFAERWAAAKATTDARVVAVVETAIKDL